MRREHRIHLEELMNPDLVSEIRGREQHRSPLRRFSVSPTATSNIVNAFAGATFMKRYLIWNAAS